MDAIPKLKLTLKLGSSGASSGKATPTPNGGPAVGGPPKGPRSLQAAQRPAKGPANTSHPNTKSAGHSAAAAGATKSSSHKPRNSKMQVNVSFRPRQWRLEKVAVRTLSGHTFDVPAWTSAVAKATAAAGSGGAALPPTFVCPQSGCHKIFDSKDKWRRHQHGHAKKHRERGAGKGKGCSDGSF